MRHNNYRLFSEKSLKENLKDLDEEYKVKSNLAGTALVGASVAGLLGNKKNDERLEGKAKESIENVKNRTQKKIERKTKSSERSKAVTEFSGKVKRIFKPKNSKDINSKVDTTKKNIDSVLKDTIDKLKGKESKSIKRIENRLKRTKIANRVIPSAAILLGTGLVAKNVSSTVKKRKESKKEDKK